MVGEETISSRAGFGRTIATSVSRKCPPSSVRNYASVECMYCMSYNYITHSLLTRTHPVLGAYTLHTDLKSMRLVPLKKRPRRNRPNLRSNVPWKFKFT